VDLEEIRRKRQAHWKAEEAKMLGSDMSHEERGNWYKAMSQKVYEEAKRMYEEYKEENCIDGKGKRGP
jgi:hypothetical protein